MPKTKKKPVEVFEENEEEILPEEPSFQPADEYADLIDLGAHIFIEIQSFEDDLMALEFDVVGLLPSVVNAVRRALLVEVPSMAPETILLQQNNSVMADEVLGHRLGLIPFRADPRQFKFRERHSTQDSPQYALIFELRKIAPKQPLDTDKKFTNTPVYSKDFRWLRDPIAHEFIPDDSRVRPVFDDILINVLRPGQEMDLRFHVVKGIGKDHIKFSPVSLASYRFMPRINLEHEITGESAVLLQKNFANGVVSVEENSNGVPTAKVVNPRLDRRDDNYAIDRSLKKAVIVDRDTNHMIFSVESVGAIPASTLVLQACKLLKERCDYHFSSIGFHRRESDPINE